jgi:hypothetical protein
MGGSEAETIHQPRDRLKGQPQEGQHSAAVFGGTRDRLPPARGAAYLARWDCHPQGRDLASRPFRDLRGSVSAANKARSGDCRTRKTKTSWPWGAASRTRKAFARSRICQRRRARLEAFVSFSKCDRAKPIDENGSDTEQLSISCRSCVQDDLSRARASSESLRVGVMWVPPYRAGCDARESPLRNHAGLATLPLTDETVAQMPQRRGTSKKTLGVKDIVILVGAPDEIAPVDDSAFEKKAGELIARAGSAGKRANGRSLKARHASTPRKREK